MATLMQQQPQQKVSGKRNNETISMYCYSIVCLSFCTSFDLIFFFSVSVDAMKVRGKRKSELLWRPAYSLLNYFTKWITKKCFSILFYAIKRFEFRLK